MKKLNHEQLLNLLKKKQGDRSAREFAGELGISHVYLTHIYGGKREPGPAVLQKLGLRREIVYEAS
jgi:transcriptional regulator with XRE-family HTH domain